MVSCTGGGQQNPGGFRFCGSCGSQLERHAAGREVRKTITVLFCDLAGSTVLAERLEPESLQRVLPDSEIAASRRRPTKREAEA
jgi:hypothetical protein